MGRVALMLRSFEVQPPFYFAFFFSFFFNLPSMPRGKNALLSKNGLGWMDGWMDGGRRSEVTSVWTS